MALNNLESPKIYIVILNYNSWEDTIECLESVINSEFKDFQIILLDNDSPNSSEKRILEYLEGKRKPFIKNDYFKARIKDRDGCLPFNFFLFENRTIDINIGTRSESEVLKYPIVFIQTNKNIGFAGGNNIALDILLGSNISESSKVLLLNPDTFIFDKTLENLSKIENENFIAGCAIKEYQNPSKLSFYGGYMFFKPFAIIRPIVDLKNRKSIDYIYGGALLTNIRTIRKNGLLPSEYFLYWEETDWSYKAKKLDIDLILSENSIVYDKVGTSIGRGYLAHYYYIRNGLIFYKKHHKLYIPTLLLFNIIRFFNKVRKGEWENSKAIFNGTKDFFRKKKGFTFIS